MILDKLAKAIIDKVPENNREDIVTGIITGIGVGTIAGIIAGIGAGIIAGIITGIGIGTIAGIGAGIIAGIITGIGVGTIVGIIAGIGDFISSPPLMLIIIAILFIVSEILFLFDKEKPEGQPYFIFTIKRKVVACTESSIILFSLIGLRQSVMKGYPITKDFLGQYESSILNFIGWGTAIIIILYLYIKVNSLKYKKEK